MSAERKRKDLTQGPVLRTLVLFVLPILGGSIVTQLYGLADSVIVGRLIGKNALAAVSASAPVTTVVNLFLMGLSTGSGVVLAQTYGSGNTESLQRVIDSISSLTLILAAILTVLGMGITWPLLKIMGTPADIFRDAFLYLMIIFMGTIGQTVYQLGSGALRGMGDSYWAFIFLLICSVLNILLDVVAVAVFHWGVWGAALATAFSQLIFALGIIWRLNHGGYGLKIRGGKLRVDKGDAKEIIRIGLPASLQSAGNSIASIFVQSFINVFGVTFIAANMVVNRVDMFACMPAMAVGTAMSAFTGQNIARNKERVYKGISVSMLLAFGIGIVFCVLLILLKDILPLAFNSDQEVVSLAARGLMITAVSAVFQGVDSCLVNAMRGAGRSFVPMITSMLGSYSRIPLVYFLAVRPDNSLGAFWAITIASGLRAAAIIIYYFFLGGKKAIENFDPEKIRRR